MHAALLSLTTAALYALHNVLIKKGLSTSNPVTATITSVAVNTILLWIISIIFIPFHYLVLPWMGIFFVVGLFQPGLTRLLTNKGIQELGVSITDPLRAITPMFSSILAIIILGEQISLTVLVGTFLIIIGITILSYRQSSPDRVRLRFMLYPILASFLGGLSQVLRKTGLNFIPQPLLAATVTTTSSFLVLSSILLIHRKKRNYLMLTKQCIPFYLSAGIAVSLAMIALYYALTLGDVIVIAPLVSTGPLFALTLSAFFLRESEEVTPRIILGACLIVIGVIFITWRN